MTAPSSASQIGRNSSVVILQQIYYRYYHGRTKDKRFAVMIDQVRELEKRCLEIIGQGRRATAALLIG